MTGLKSMEEGERSINIILEAIRDLKGKILYNISDSYYDENIKKGSTEDVMVKCVGCDNEFTYHIMKLSDDCGCYLCKVCADKYDSCPSKSCNTSFLKNALVHPSASVKDFNIVLINSDYKANFRINQKSYIH